jgi:malonyl-CoA/methylmalonyl-CoA synthetase
MNANLYAVLRAGFPRGADAPCMELDSGAVVAYGDLEALAGRIARALVAAGCARGDRVAAQVEKSWEAVALYLGCLRAGLVFLPLNTGYQRGELAYFFGNAEPRAIVTRAASVAMTREVAPAGSTVFTLEDDGTGTLLDAARSEPADFDTVVSAPGDLAAILYTSGTTGRSKGAMLSHANLAANARVLVDFWGFTAGDVLLHALPIYHVHGLFVATHCALLSGSRMIFLRRFEPRPVIARLPRSTVMMGVPTFYTRLLADPAFGRECCAGVRLFVSGSAPLLAETFAEFERRTGQRILERYGMTETGMNTSNPLAGERIAGTVGPPLPGVSVRIVGEGGAECPPGTIGDIQVRGENVFGGYWRMPEKNVEEFTADGWFRTGDMGEWLPNGYVRIVGRAKDLIITGGLNVYPKEIEEAIDALPGVAESAVIGLPDPDFGEAVTAVVVPRQASSLAGADVVGALKARIASFKVPKRVFVVDELPRNAMGKVQKNVLRERFSEKR